MVPQTFAPSKGTRPSEIKLATVFEVFESVMHRFGRFASLMEIVRDVLARAVYVDPPQRPPMESRSLVDGGTVRMKGVRSASIGVEDALTSYVWPCTCAWGRWCRCDWTSMETCARDSRRM